MSFIDLFQPVSEWSVAQAREFLCGQHPEDYQLIDVRQLAEYGDQHLPGARWIPAEELPERLGELDPERTTIVYCAVGIRSRAAVAVLNRAGFSDAHNLQGGIRAWQGHVASGLPEACFDHFAGVQDAADYAVLAWQLEENTRRFYDQLAEILKEPAVAANFAELAAAENHHKAMLKSVWEALKGVPAAADFPEGLLRDPDDDHMEGGMRLSEALDWVAGRPSADALDLAMAIEINAYDNYLNFYGALADEDARRVFELLAIEERHHIKRLGTMLEKHLPLT